MKKRQPITALKMFFELITSPSLPKREADIASAIGEEDLDDHLDRLVKAGLIQYNAIKVNTPYSRYRLSNSIPKRELPIYLHFRTLTNVVFGIFSKNSGKFLTIEDVYDLLPQESKDRYRAKERLLTNLSNLLSYLNKNEYFELENFRQGKQSEINITGNQRMILSELLEIIDRFQDNDEEVFRRGRRLAEEIAHDPQRVSSLLRRAKKASSAANKSPRLKTNKDILDILSSYTNGLTGRQIQELLQDYYGKTLELASVQVLTFSLEKQNLVDVVKKGSVKIFFTKSTPQDD